MNNNASKVNAICEALQSFADINGQTGIAIAEKIDRLFKRTLVRSANLEIELLPNFVQRKIAIAISEPTLTLCMDDEYQLQTAA